MRMESRQLNTETHGELSSAHFGIDTANQAHIIGILRDKLYSDKPMAVLREYATNAWDAHVEAGIGDRPIQVTLPSRFNPELIIRDFGPGISEEDVYNTYIKYGASSKRDTNTAVGMMGIGCKSGFAYSDVFTVISCHNGVKSTYSAFIDDTGLGQMTKLGEQATVENGITIKVPIKMQDVQVFKDKAVQLFQFFDPRPDINIKLPKHDYTVTGTGWALVDEGTGATAIMGNIGYPIRGDRLSIPENLKNLLQSNIHLSFPIGALSIAANREDLEYTDKTARALKVSLQIVIRELAANLRKQLDEAKNLFEARLIYQKATGAGAWTYHGYGNRRARNLTYDVAQACRMWKGHDLSVTIYDGPYEDDDMEIRLLLPGRKGSVGVGTGRSVYSSQRQIDKNLIIAIVDVKSSWRLLASALVKQLENDPKSPVVRGSVAAIKFKTDDADAQELALKGWVKNQNLDGVPVFKLSEVNLPTSAKLQTVRDATIAKKASKKVFRAKLEDWNIRPRAASQNWEVAQADLKDGKGLWLEIDHFKSEKCVRFPDVIETLKAIGEDVSKIEVIGVKKKEVDKVGPGWQCFAEWYDAKLLSWMKAQGDLSDILAAKDISNWTHPDASKAYANRGKSIIAAGLDSKHPVCQFFTEVARLLKKNQDLRGNDSQRYDVIRRLIRSMSRDQRPKPSYNAAEAIKQLQQKYELLEWTNIFAVPTYQIERGDGGGHAHPEHAKKWVNYINLVDSQEN